jgi:hypothetical protein
MLNKKQIKLHFFLSLHQRCSLKVRPYAFCHLAKSEEQCLLIRFDVKGESPKSIFTKHLV